MAETIYIATDHTAQFGVLRHHVGVDDMTGTPVLGATVTATLLDKNNMALDPQPKPFPMTFTDAGDGDYTAPIPYDHGLQRGVLYVGRFKAVGNGVQREWDSKFTVERGTI